MGKISRAYSKARTREARKGLKLENPSIFKVDVIKERVAYAEIDWHDFCIVESVDFPLHERSDLPTPVTKEELGVRMARMVRIEQTGYDEQAEQAQRLEPEQQPEQAQLIPQKPQIIERDLGKEVTFVLSLFFYNFIS